MKDPLRILSEEARKKLRRRQQPAWCRPMLATLAGAPFSDREWIFETKLDGERVLAFRRGARVGLWSRNRKLLNDTYPELRDALDKQPSQDFIVDGEVVAFEHGISSFSRLQGRMQIKDPKKARQSRIAVHYYLFDLLHLNGLGTTHLPLLDRKALLKAAFRFNNPLHFSLHRNEKGKAYLEEACKKGLEGLIAKRAESEYVQRRSTDWLKFKCSHEQEFVIGGFTDPQGERIGFGALLIGYYKGDALHYAGMVGTGYDENMLRRLGQELKRIERKLPPFQQEGLPRRNLHWVRPLLVGQVAFTDWTGGGKLRHPRFKGLRRDKNPRGVVREKPKA